MSLPQFIRQLVCCACLLGINGPLASAESTNRNHDKPLILAHFMPWFEADLKKDYWGWHWTMNTFKPSEIVNGRRKIASHFYPLIGPYDSGDEDVLECQLLQMKLAGIDGVIVDWYGLTSFRDYAVLHRNTERLVRQITRFGMQFAICYEDQTIPALVESGKLASNERVSHAAGEITWLHKNWFSLKSYVRVDGKPLLLSFGQTGLTDDEWSQCIINLNMPVAYVSQHHRRSSATGTFDWPIPQDGLNAVDRFLTNHKESPLSIPVAFPRFVDIYAEAKVQKSWGNISDNDGNTFKTTVTKALMSKPRFIQIATWNDWGEGTMIEPSLEHRYRDLEAMQILRRKHIEPRFSPTPADLEMPAVILSLRRQTSSNTKQLDEIVRHILNADLPSARSLFKRISQEN